MASLSGPKDDDAEPALTHQRPGGGVTMVDVGAKASTPRAARARARVRMQPATGNALRNTAESRKGDALTTAQLAGIMAAKRTGELIPLAHSLPLSLVDVRFAWIEDGLLEIESEARTTGQTGVEMEAMIAAAVAALTVYDMIKGVERGVAIEEVRLLSKEGGKSGPWRHRDATGTT